MEIEPTCTFCGGRGWYYEVVKETAHLNIPDCQEKYCECLKGIELKEAESK